MKVAEWYDEAQRLRAAGLDELAAFYAENAKRVANGQAPIWPIPPELRVSTHLAAAEPRAFIDDGREAAHAATGEVADGTS